MGIAGKCTAMAALVLASAGTAAQPKESMSYATPADLPALAGMPSPLKGSDGTTIATAAAWKAHREAMKRLIEYYGIGHMPPAPGNVAGKDLRSETLAGGTVNYRLVHLSFGPDSKLGFDAAILAPAGEGPFPTIVQPSFQETPGVGIPAGQTEPTTRTTQVRRGSGYGTTPVGLEDAARQNREALRRGYALMIFYYQQCGADARDNRQTGFFPAYPDCDWGTVAAWAWGMSRCVDYLETQPFADKTKLIATGHSRLGKAALVAGAFDERFALVAPAGSGAGGTGAFRFNGKQRLGAKEGLAEVTKSFPHWFGPHLKEFSGADAKLPYDQHWLISLVAPRAFVALEGLDDTAANGKATAESYLAAKPVFAMLGAESRIGIHFRPGGHAYSPEDWAAMLDFADRELRGMKAERKFDDLPPAGSLH